MTETRNRSGVVPRKSCPACEHPERSTIDRALAIGQAPRSIVCRYSGLPRKAVQRHRDGCLVGGKGGIVATPHNPGESGEA